MNILILSAGTRNKLVEAFKETIHGNVIATDMSDIAPAVYVADKFYQVPRITEPHYIDLILDICKKEQIDAVLSLIDPELELIAENSERFARIGAKVIGSSYQLCRMSLNKMDMYRWLKGHGYNCAASYDDLEAFKAAYAEGKIDFPVFVKPVCGSASLGITRADNMEIVEFLFGMKDGLMIQEYLKGQELGIDCYIDMISGEVVSIFAKKKLLMRAGETDKAVSFKNEDLFKLIERFVIEVGYRGQIDIDMFEMDGKYYISEVNPRFGGGYPHAYACGVNHAKLIENNAKGKVNPRQIGQYDEGIVMMKYNEIMTRRQTL